tara:strand:+ start:37 stop:1266 length:1230 start_codon:yes stop_codon:yes gene_type:complete
MKPNVVIIGSGHYVTGKTILSKTRKTDKDLGVILPAVAYLKKINKINDIFITSVNGDALQKKIKKWKSETKDIFGNLSVNLSPEKGENNESSYKKVLRKTQKPCIAIISTPDHTHKKIIKECIKNEVPFFVVKPAVTKLSDFYQLREMLDDSSISGMVDFHKVFDESNFVLKDKIQKKELGDLYHISSVMTQRKTMLDIYSRWLERDDAPNINHYLGSHYIHLTSFITGAIPIEVRSTSQELGEDFGRLSKIPSMIQTQVKWKLPKQNFYSYHLAGWADPEKSESMTTQEITLFGSKGKIHSDQKFRGTYTISEEKGFSIENPYFFNLNKGLKDQINLKNKYGFNSIEYFLDSCVESNFLKFNKNDFFPSFHESENVTAILEAADLSLKNSSRIIKILKKDKKYRLLKQ